METRILLATLAVLMGGPVAMAPALAADLGRPIPVVEVMESVPFRWTGFYLGGHLGAGWPNMAAEAPGIGMYASNNDVQFIGGGQLGYNYQSGPWVVGVEGSLSWASFDEVRRAAIPGGVLTSEATSDWIATLTGRLGYAADRWLIYAKGGFAWSHGSATVRSSAAPAWTVSASDTSTGWLVGGGIEYALSRSWSARLEYNYVGMDDRAVPGTNVNLSNSIQTVTLGINYRF